MITGGYLNVDWIQFTDPNDTTTSIAKNVKLAPQTASYNVFGATGKFLGRIERAGSSLSQTLKQAGYANGVYIMRAVGMGKALRVQVK